MKAIALVLFMLVAGSHTASSQWKKDRTVSGFTGLSVTSGIDVYLTQGNSEKLTLDVRGLEEDQIVSRVRNGVLELYVDRKGMNWNFNQGNSVKAYITFKQLTNLQANGGSDVFGQGTLSFNDLNVDASGGSDVKLDLRAERLNVSASGGADAILQGSARTLNASGSGGSDLDARKLIAETCNASSSGGSDVYVNASKEMSLKASGGSDIYYYGHGKVLASSKSGGSDIKRKD
ncbi:hypothetical protein GCM10028819_01970 [Spirosoma humi]